MNISRRKAGKYGFTLIEIFVVFGLLIFLLMAVYKIFFSQAKMVSVSMETMKVNDHFRRIQVFIGNDIREATWIAFPTPVRLDETPNLVTPKPPCVVLRVVKQEVDPFSKFSDPPSANPVATDTFGQVVRVREIMYELRPLKKDTPGSPPPPPGSLMKLVRTELIKEKDSSRKPLEQELEITDTVRDFILFRTLRKPMQPQDIAKPDDVLLEPLASHNAGTGNDVVHLRVTLERKRDKTPGDVYEISMTTSFYKRGKEVFVHQ